MVNSIKSKPQLKASSKHNKKCLPFIGRETLAKTYAVLKNCIPGHTYYHVSGQVWDKDFPKAWPFETQDEIETVKNIAKWHSGDPDLGRIEIVKANVTNVVFQTRYQGPKFDIDDIEDGMSPRCHVLNRTSPASQFVAIMNEINGEKYWITDSFPFDKDVPQLFPYETKHEKEAANKIADTFAKDKITGAVSLVMVNISKTVMSFNEKKRQKIVDRSVLIPKAKKAKSGQPEQ